MLFVQWLKTPWMLLKDTVFLYHMCTVSRKNWFTNRKKTLSQEPSRVNFLNRSCGREWKALHPAGYFSALKDLTGSAAQEEGSDGQRRVCEQEGTRISVWLQAAGYEEKEWVARTSLLRQKYFKTFCWKGMPSIDLVREGVGNKKNNKPAFQQ